jgi:hypothetical protein
MACIDSDQYGKSVPQPRREEALTDQPDLVLDLSLLPARRRSAGDHPKLRCPKSRNCGWQLRSDPLALWDIALARDGSAAHRLARRANALVSGHKELKMLQRYTHLRAEDLVHRLA